MKGSRFRELRIAPDLLRAEADRLLPALKALRDDHHAGRLCDARTTLLIVLVFHRQRSRQPGYIRHAVDQRQLRPRAGALCPERYGLDRQETAGLVYSHNLRHLPQTVMRALRVWLRHPRRLRLIDRVVTAEEMIIAQAEGFRWVSMDWEAGFSGRWVDADRDAFEFLLHDLAHAGHFLADANQYRRQVAFFTAIRTWLDAGRWDVYLRDPVFQAQFDYLAADMNTHFHHSMLFTRAILIGYYLRLEGKSGAAHLSTEHAARLRAFWNEWVRHAGAHSKQFVIDELIEHIHVPILQETASLAILEKHTTTIRGE